MWLPQLQFFLRRQVARCTATATPAKTLTTGHNHAATIRYVPSRATAQTMCYHVAAHN